MKSGSNSLPEYDLPNAYHFVVSFGTEFGGNDASFQEVSGIGAKLITEPVAEGGVGHQHQLPKEVKYETLKLSRGISDIDSPLAKWCKAIFESEHMEPIIPMTISVHLLDAQGWPSRSWRFVNAFPIAWNVDPFNSTKNQLAIEKIELQYSYFNRVS